MIRTCYLDAPKKYNFDKTMAALIKINAERLLCDVTRMTSVDLGRPSAKARPDVKFDDRW